MLQGLHTARGAGLDHRVHLLELALTDQVPHRVVGQHDLHRGDPPPAVGGGQQRLRDDTLDRRGELRADLSLLLAREDVDDAVDRRRRAARVQRREDEMPRLRRRQRGGDRFEVPHLAEQDHVGVLAEGAAQSFGKPARVAADLALVDEALAVAVEELDRILDRQDVRGTGPVDLVDHRRQRRRLPGAGRSSDQDEAAR